jgi:hypothetical protein
VEVILLRGAEEDLWSARVKYEEISQAWAKPSNGNSALATDRAQEVFQQIGAATVRKPEGQ